MSTNEIAFMSLSVIFAFLFYGMATADTGAAGVLGLCIAAGWTISAPIRRLVA